MPAAAFRVACTEGAEIDRQDRTMNTLDFNGEVVLNVDGNRYSASYQIRYGVITVTFGTTSRIVRVGEVVVSAQSLARTILRAMVKENCRPADLKRKADGQNGCMPSSIAVSHTEL